MKKVITFSLCAALAAAVAGAAPAASRRDKMARILSAEDRRMSGGLADLLHDTDAGVRRRAALAAARIGDTSLLLSVADRLGDPVAEVRVMAAFALGEMGETRMVGRLEGALKDHDSDVRARAAEALGRIGDPHAGPAIMQMILAAVPKGIAPLVVRGDDPGSATDPWLELRLGLFALAALKDTPSATAVLLESGRPRFDWWASTWVAARLQARELQPVLLAAAGSTDKLSRALAASGLALGRDSSAVDALLALAKDREETVAVRALSALGATGDDRVRPVLEAALRGNNARLKLAALQSLMALPPAKRERDDLVSLLGHEEPAIRAGAMRVLARLDPADLALVLSGMGRDAQWSVRAALAEGLAGGRDELSLGLLFGLLRDDDGRVVAAALAALQASQGNEAVLSLVQQLGHADVGVRTAAARGLAALGDAAHGPELNAAYRRAQSDDGPAARLAIVDALAAAGGDAALEALRAAVRDDRERSVRDAAARALSARGEAPSPSSGEPARPAYDYVRAMAPYDPRPDGPVFTPRVFLHTRRGTIEIHLNSLEAPLATESFLALARRGYLTGLEFHRVFSGVGVESGCARGDGRGGPGYSVRREVGLRPFGRGAVGLDASAKDAEGGRFFITLVPEPSRDGRATLVGNVANGLEVVEALRQHDTIEDVEVWE